MHPARFLLPLLVALALLLGQQGAALHALGHMLAQQSQQDKQAPHSPACEQCAAYAQLGDALNSGTHVFALEAALADGVAHSVATLLSIRLLAAAARGPPALLQKSA